MTGTSEADRVALMQRAWDAYPDFEVAIAVAREREGIAIRDA
jgi:hypothetical protein